MALFSELPLELFPVIITHVPLIFRSQTSLALALSCHDMYQAMVPHVLYRNVRLVGEYQATSILTRFVASAGLVTNNFENRSNIPISQYVHHLCINSLIKTPVRISGHSLDVLQKLVDAEGLRNLSILTLQFIGEWDEIENDDLTSSFLKLPPSLLQSLKKKCPNLKALRLSNFLQEFGKEWIESDIFSQELLADVRVESELLGYLEPALNFSALPRNLRSLELRVCDTLQSKEIDASGLLNCVIHDLRVLILDNFRVNSSTSTNAFWKAHPKIERLELWPDVSGDWFNEFEAGMLPNLRFLQCHIDQAFVILPFISNSLNRLGVMGTYNAQAPYLLRTAVESGTLPTLRSLSIQRSSGNSQKPRRGHMWREDEDGNVSEANKMRPARQFDGNYIMSLSKAAPCLEELELMGTSNDTIDSITESLSRFPKLCRLLLSGGINPYDKPFFMRSPNWDEYSEYDMGGVPEKDYGEYAPRSFMEAALDLGNGCRSLETITMGNHFGELEIRGGLSAKIIRDGERGPVKELKRITPWGNIVEKENEW